MINLDDFNLDAVSEKVKEQEEVIDENEAMDRAEQSDAAEDSTIVTESYKPLWNAYDFGDSSVVGTESFDNSQLADPTVIVRQAPQVPPIFIRTADGQNFRVYFSMNAIFRPMLVTALCRFLDTRNEGETVTFILGSGLRDEQSHAVGAVVSAMSSSKAHIKAVAAGWCSITETILWTAATESEIYKYGALTFGISELIKSVPKFKTYFELFLNKAKQLGLLSDEELKNIWDTGQTKMITYEDYQKIHRGATQPQE